MPNTPYAKSVREFLADDTDAILGQLTISDKNAGFGQLLHTQVGAWQGQLSILQKALSKCADQIANAGIVLEYAIPRRSKRLDAAVIFGDTAIVFEFKVGKARVDSVDRAQVEDYCQDLRDFHLASRRMTFVPVLVPTAIRPQPVKILEPINAITPVIVVSPDSIPAVIAQSLDHFVSKVPCDIQGWTASGYMPTPTIIEAACHLYSQMDVAEIARSHAGADNLRATSAAVLDAIRTASETNQKLICFITGVPGAGKTLAGLNIVHNAALHSDGDLGVFLSGNGPLVKVLREALARDESERSGARLAEARRKTSTFIQNVHQFLDTYAENSALPPDRVIIFDEAQRAWNAEHAYRKFKRASSEPELMLNIMSRHSGWAVLVCLIGGGQEINTGEAGLPEWGRVLAERHPNWRVLISDRLVTGSHSTGGQPLFAKLPSHIQVTTSSALHLDVSLRSYRAEKLSEWVSYVIDGDPAVARRIAKDHLADYPLYLTRDLSEARDWLRLQRRGTRRAGLLAASGARRMRAYGLDVTAEFRVEDWFLAPSSDVRSSSFLELPATEFQVQGLELDWTCVCWGADLRRREQTWSFNQFLGTRWTKVNRREEQQYMLNTYRVLLTRAREGCVVWVPRGSATDETRTPEFYFETANYLLQCGMRPLIEVLPAVDTHVSVLAAAISRDGKYLLCRRPANKRHGGLWEFPGGKVERGETWEGAAQRELTEELGLTVTGVSERLFAAADPQSNFSINFFAVQVEGQPAALEHDEVRWIAPVEMLEMALAPADRNFAQWLNRTNSLMDV